MSAGIMDLNNSGKLEIDLYFDFNCPWAYQASLWLRDVEEMMGVDLVDLRWKFVSLAQINRPDENWNVWEQTPDGDNPPGLLAFLAGAAALKSGGNTALGKFYREAGRLHFEEEEVLDKATIEKAATAAGVDVSAAFNGSDPSLAETLKEHHTEGVTKYGVFGSSTVVFEEKYGVYLKLMPHPAYDKVLTVFQHVQMMAMVEKNLFEIKRIMTKEQENDLYTEVKNLYTKEEE